LHVLATALLLINSAAAAAPVRVDLAPEIDLEAHLTVLAGAAANQDAAHAFAALDEQAFQPLGKDGAQFGFIAEPIWLAARLENGGDTPLTRLLVIAQPRLDRIEVYTREGATMRPLGVLGDHMRFDQRTRNFRHPNLALPLPARSGVDLLLKVQSQSSIQVPAKLYDEGAFDTYTRGVDVIDALYFGLLIALLLYNLALLLAVGDRTYLHYVVYLGAFATMMLALSGIGFQLLWPDNPGFNAVAVPCFAMVLLAASTNFQRVFLDLPRQMPRMDRAFRAIVWGSLLFAMLSPLIPTRTANIVTNFGFTVLSTVVMASAVLCAWRGYRPANFFVVAWALLLLGGVSIPLKNFGLLPVSMFTEYGIQLGSALEMLLLAFALAYRINLLRGENERLLTETRVSLEHRVDERTRALHHALRELEAANQQLHESSLRDGLTGVYNRRYLDSALEDMAQRARLHHLPLALLMIDLDNFKTINDQYGHNAGDDCLRAIAARIAAPVDELPEAFIARYGGEEFVVVLPMTDALGAAAFAERLRTSVARLPVATTRGEIPVTISVGVAALQRQDNAVDMLARADQALYRAKRQGRDCVVAA
jgi:diguanylate cyclase (GGDEF)-like protein